MYIVKDLRAAPLGWLALLASCNGVPERQSTYLDAAEATGRWLQTIARDDREGSFMPDEYERPSSSTVSLGVGAAGRSLFLLELHHATGDRSFSTSAVREIDRALSLALRAEHSERRFGLYNGLAGVAFAATEFFRATGEPRYRRAALRLAHDLAQAAQDDGTGSVSWGAAEDILAGSAGIGLALLHMASALDDTLAVQLARQVGTGLLTRARADNGGLWWSRTTDGDLNLPNFSHGTAGVGYFLTSLYRATADSQFLDATERAAVYLQNVADRSDRLFLVPYGIPDVGYVTAYDIGWAHGPAGTGSFFQAIAEATGRAEYTAIVDANARTLAAAGIPGVTTDPRRWTGPFRVDRRFGTSGAAVFLLRMTRSQPTSPYRHLAREVVDDFLMRAERDEQGLRWTLPRYGFQGNEGQPSTFTGFFYGAAGLGLTLLEMHYAEVGQTPFVRWPDDPFSEESPIP